MGRGEEGRSEEIEEMIVVIAMRGNARCTVRQ